MDTEKRHHDSFHTKSHGLIGFGLPRFQTKTDKPLKPNNQWLHRIACYIYPATLDNPQRVLISRPCSLTEQGQAGLISQLCFHSRGEPSNIPASGTSELIFFRGCQQLCVWYECDFLMSSPHADFSGSEGWCKTDWAGKSRWRLRAHGRIFRSVYNGDGNTTIAWTTVDTTTTTAK